MTFAVMTLGCKVNAYESKVMIDSLIKREYKLVNFSERADIYIINTCTVTNKADQKSRKMIRQAIKRNKEAIIIVVGCLVQINEKTISQMKEVDILLGTFQKSKIGDHLDNFIKNNQKIKIIEDVSNLSFEEMKITSSNKTRAFVKIQDGCQNYCSYCIIPYARGYVRSKSPSLVIEEINDLVANGHKEIVLTGICTGQYGLDLENYSLSQLLREIVKIKKLLRVRLSSIEITELNDEFMEVLKKHDKIVNHMHIPLQSGSNEILRAMNRKYNVETFKKTIKKLREVRPQMLITTDVIVGFPGETEVLFKETVDTIESLNFFNLHVFPYSKRDGTLAAKMKRQVNGILKKERVHQLLELSKAKEQLIMKSYLNKIVSFLPEVYKDGYLEGHADNYLSVKVKGNHHLLNQSFKVLIKDIEESFCLGIIVDKED